MFIFCKKSLLLLILSPLLIMEGFAENERHSNATSTSLPDSIINLKLINDSLFQKSIEPIIDNLDPEFILNWVEWIMEEEMIPGMSLCFLKDGELYWQAHQGFADLQEQTPVNDQTAFVCGSVSKIIVLTAAMQLYEQNLLGLDDDVNQHLPFNIYNPNHPDEAISIRHLMTHLSSINDDEDLLESLITFGSDSSIPLGDFLEDYLCLEGMYYDPQNYLEEPPRSTFNYSNIAVSLLAHIVEEISGQNFETYCRDNIFDPLGMDNVSFKLANMDPNLMATPYNRHNDTLLPMPHIGLPIYPAGLLKSSAVNLSKFLGMYMNGGTCNQQTILQQPTIDTIMSLQYPEILQENPMGLMWFYNFGFFRHGGSLPGAQAEIAFSKDLRSGLVTLGNTSNSEWSEFIEFFLLAYSRHYEPFSVEYINIIDKDGDGLLETGEEAQIILDIKNNINLTNLISNVSLELHSNDPNVCVSNGTSSIGSMQYRDTVSNATDPFIIQIGDHNAHYRSMLDLIIRWNSNKLYETEIELEIGAGEILLVNDAKTFGGMFMQSDFWYKQVLDSLGRDYYLYDVDLFGDPSAVFMENFPVVIWYTGSHLANTLNEENCEELAKYLEHGGRLFLSGQNISSELMDNDFLYEYLHTGHLSNSYDGSDSLVGVSGDPLGSGLVLKVNQGFDAYFQFSLSELQAVNGGINSFDYASSGNAGAIRFENNTYKTVFMGFGFEGINNFDTRQELMNRILAYFGETLGAGEVEAKETDTVRIYPNPVLDKACIVFTLKNPANASIQIFDQKGILIKNRQLGIKQKGQHQIWLSTDGYEPGIYYYRLLLEDEQFTGRFIVL